jgi:hypothetical protein
MRSMTLTPARTRWVLALGDVLVVVLAALAGFVRHGELGNTGVVRVAATVVPFTLAWFAAAPWLGCFDPGRTARLSNLWRVPAAAVLAAPLGAVLRALWLRAPVLPIFAVVMAAVLSAALLAWRALAARLLRPSKLPPA